MLAGNIENDPGPLADRLLQVHPSVFPTPPFHSSDPAPSGAAVIDTDNIMNEANLDERLSLTRRTMALLEAWGLSAKDMCTILSLPDTIKPRAIARFREDEPFPDDAAVNRRITYLIRIEQALHTYFPRNPEMRSIWVKRGNKQFGKRAPVAVMVEDGESGLVFVLSHLDCTFAWDMTGSKSDYSRGKDVS